MTIVEIMTMWADWHRSERSNIGYPRKALAIATGGVNCWDDIADGVDSWICSETDTAVNDLSPAQSCAIHHRFLYANYRFPRGNYPEMLLSALMNVSERLIKRGVVVELDNERLMD